MLIRGIEGDREVGSSYLSRQESGGGDFRSGPEREGKFQKGPGLRWWERGGKVSKLTSTKIKRSVGVKTSPYTSCYA
jgi:hypothetical protein